MTFLSESLRKPLSAPLDPMPIVDASLELRHIFIFDLTPQSVIIKDTFCYFMMLQHHLVAIVCITIQTQEVGSCKVNSISLVILRGNIFSPQHKLG